MGALGNTQGRKSIHSNAFIFLLAFVIGAQPIATDMYLPAMPDLAKGVPEWTLAGFTFASTSTLTFFTLFYGLGQVMGGQWVDRYGRRVSLLMALMVYVLCSLGCVYSPSMAWLLALRSVQGLATAVIVVAARAALRDSFSVEDAPKAMAQIFVRMGLIVIACPLAGGWLATHGGWRMSLMAMTIYGFLLLIWTAWQFPETQVRASTTKATATPIPTAASAALAASVATRQLWRSRSFRIWTLIASFTIAGVFTFLTITSHIFVGYLAWTPREYSFVLMGAACVFVASNFVCARLLKQCSPHCIAKLGAGLSLMGGCVLCCSAWWLSREVTPWFPVGLLLGHYIYQMGHGMLQSCAMTGAVADFPQMAGRAAAWSGLTMMVVAFAISQLAASFVTRAHTYGVWPWALTILGCGAMLALLVFGQNKATSPSIE